MFDRIEAGTYLVAAAITEGNLKIKQENLFDDVYIKENQ